MSMFLNRNNIFFFCSESFNSKGLLDFTIAKHFKITEDC